MVPVAGGGIVGCRVEEFFEAAYPRPVTLNPPVQVGHPRGEGLVAVDDEASAHDVGLLQRAEVGGDPVVRQPRIRVGGQEDAVLPADLVQRVRARVQRHAPGGPHMGVGRGEARLDQPHIQAVEAPGADGIGRPVGAVVGQHDDPHRSLRILAREGSEEERQTLGLVPGWHADDAGAHPRPPVSRGSPRPGAGSATRARRRGRSPLRK